MISPIAGTDFSNFVKTEMQKARILKSESEFKNILDAQKDKLKQLKQKKLKNATEDFESIFIYQMLKSMRKTVPKGGILDGGLAEDIWQGFLDEEYAKVMAHNANFDLAKKMYDQLSKGL